MLRWLKILPLFTLALSGCLSPSYNDTKTANAKTGNANPFGDVAFHVYDSYTQNPPNCVAVLPFSYSSTGEFPVSADQAEVVRKALYAHLAPQGKMDVELPRIDFVIENMPEADRTNDALIGEKLNCEALITGNVSAFGSQYIGFYSKVAVGAQLKMIRASNGEPLWEGGHLATTHGGSVPLSPIGIATGLLDAAMNVDEEQTFRVVDDLTRRLVLTIPDNHIAALEDPLSPLKMTERANLNARQSLDDFIRGLTYKTAPQQKEDLFKAIADEVFHGNDLKRVYETLIQTAPKNARANGLYARYLVKGGDYYKAAHYVDTSLSFEPENDAMHFLKGRIQIKLNDFAGGDTSILKAIALQPKSTKYLNGLGFLNSLRGHHERALAAYQMAVDLDPLNGYALYNMGVTFYNLQDFQAAWDYVYQSSQVYLGTGDYGQVVKALADLKDLKALGVTTSGEIQKLEQALLAIQRTS